MDANWSRPWSTIEFWIKWIKRAWTNLHYPLSHSHLSGQLDVAPPCTCKYWSFQSQFRTHKMQLCVPGEFDHLYCKFTLLLMYKLHEIENKSVSFLILYAIIGLQTHMQYRRSNFTNFGNDDNIHILGEICKVSVLQTKLNPHNTEIKFTYTMSFDTIQQLHHLKVHFVIYNDLFTTYFSRYT